MNFKTPRYCPQCGSRSLKTDGEKTFSCPDCRFLYFHNTAATSSAIITCQDEFLMVIRAHDPCKGTLDFPGGFVERGETAEQGLLRELHEELGLLVEQPMSCLFNFTNVYPFAGIQYHTLDLYFLIRFDERPKITTDDDVSGYRWFGIDEVDQGEIGFDSVKNAVRKFQTDFPSLKTSFSR